MIAGRPIEKQPDRQNMRPDKAKVVDEVWDDARIESFLAKSPMGDEKSHDYSALLHAYRSMRPADFERFIRRFTALERDINAKSNDQQTLLATIAGHRHSASFREILERHGARG
jgi:hypothetical protein